MPLAPSRGPLRRRPVDGGGGGDAEAQEGPALRGRPGPAAPVPGRRPRPAPLGNFPPPPYTGPMPVFQVLALLSPLAVGFGVPAALAATAGGPPKRRAAAAAGTVVAVLALLLAASFTGSPKAWLPLALVLGSFGLFSAGVFLLAEGARAPRDLAQVLAGLAVSVLMSTLFWAAPLIRDAADRGSSGEAIDRRISLSLDANPFFVIGYSIFDAD